MGMDKISITVQLSNSELKFIVFFVFFIRIRTLFPPDSQAGVDMLSPQLLFCG
jgi:hypothetical protein